MDRTNFDRVIADLAGVPPGAEAERLAELLRAPPFLPFYFEFLVMRARRELGLALHVDRTTSDVPDARQESFQRMFRDACREVGDLYVEAGEPASAWLYYRGANLRERAIEGIEKWVAGPRNIPQWSQQIDGVIDALFAQGLDPVRGYELLLAHKGTCDGITLFERSFPYVGQVRDRCVALLLHQLREELRKGLIREVTRESGAAPAGEPGILELIEGRQWLFEARRTHVDESHLRAVIRIASTTDDPANLRGAIELCEYGRHLPSASQKQPPPFEDFFGDYRLFLGALLGEGVDEAVTHFRARVESAGPGRDGSCIAAQIFVQFLHRLGRNQEAVAESVRYLGKVKGKLVVAPSPIQLCELAQDPTSLRALACERGDLVALSAAALLAQAPTH